MITACALTGQWISLGLKKRIESLEQIKIMIQFFETQLNFCRTPVLDLLLKAEKRFDNRSFKFIKMCRDICDEGRSFSDAWENAVCSFIPSGFTKKDKEFLISFGNQLGRTDLEGQTAICRLYDSLFDEQLIAAKEDLRRKGSLYSGLGLAGGLLFAVISI